MTIASEFPQESLLVLRVLALLVRNATAGLARGLAGSLALAAATVLCALAEILGFQGLDHHGKILQRFRLCFIIARFSL